AGLPIDFYTSLHLHLSVFIVEWPAPPQLYPLSLHDALPILALAAELLEQDADDTPPGRIEGRRRLVEDEHARRADECLGDAEPRSEEHTSELQSPYELVCRLLLEKKKSPRTAGRPEA